MIQPIADDVEHAGFTAAHVRSVVESTLGPAGILLTKEPQQKEGFANLIVTIDAIRHPQGVYLFTVAVGVVQNVQLSRNVKLGAFPAQTWGARDLGLTTPQRLDIIDALLKQKLGEFITAFKAANAR